MEKHSLSNEKYDNKLYYYIAAGIGGILGGAYLLWSLFDEEELNEDEIEKINDIKEEILQHKDKKITPDDAIKIMYLTNHHAEEEIKKNYPEIYKKRRAALNNNYEYMQVCQEYFQIKEEFTRKANDKILEEFNTNQEELERLIQQIDPNQMEKKYFQFDIPKFKSKPSRDTTKEAFIYFGNKFLLEVQSMSSQFSSMGGMGPQAQEMMMFNIMVAKTKVEDYVYIKYEITENELRYLLNDHNLLHDPDVIAVHQKIATFENMLGG